MSQLFVASCELATNYPKDFIEDLAEESSKALNYSVGFDSLESITHRLGGKLAYLDLPMWNDEQTGSMEVRQKGDFTIYLSNSSSPLRDNFTITHELGHYILHSKFGEIPAKFNRYGSDRLEWEANWFAGAFLMPKEEFIRVNAMHFGSIINIAAYFNVSENAVLIRKKRLGI